MRSTRAIVDLSHLEHNLHVLRSRLSSGARQMAVVKADAYGHGAVPVARHALRSGCEWLGVATVQEAEELRSAGLTCPILVLGVTPVADADALVHHDLRATVCDRDSALALSSRTSAAGKRTPVHVKVDTGMGRLGIPPDQVVPYMRWLQTLPCLELEGLYSHFATADETDQSYARRQLDVFADVLRGLRQAGLSVPIRHMANTAATLTLPDSHLDLVRNGIGIYGLYPSSHLRKSVDLHPILRWETQIGHLKDVTPGTPLSYGCTFTTTRPSRIATLPVGYADGYARVLSNRSSVLIRGRRARVVGRVCMDMVLADVTEVAEVAAGDVATLIGRDGIAEISADEIARLCDTINYEVTCAIGKRVPRIYRG